ncbi:MAG TPA: DNA starvation/stationary phase protection protein, partial [Candidatus Binatia bacterium]
MPAARDRAGEKVRSFPAPKELATPTDLKPEEVGAVVEAVNPLIADSFALFIKTKNFHWHVASSHYRDYHLLLDEQAETIFASIDPLAERVRRIGGTTLRSVSHIAELQTIADDNNDFVPPDRMIR